MIEKNKIFKAVVILIFLNSLFSFYGQEKESENSIKEFLIRHHYDFQTDESGDFIINYSLGNKRKQKVFVNLRKNDIGNSSVREIFSISAEINPSWPENFYKRLLSDNFSTRYFGSWALSREKNETQELLIYLSKVPGEFSDNYLASAIHDTAESADSMELVLNPDSDEY